MKIVFHKRYYNCSYSSNPAAAKGRLDGIMEIILSKPEDYEIITPESAVEEDILQAHTVKHYHSIKSNSLLFELASLSAGGAVLAAEQAYNGNPCFAVIRPPGHHASSDSCWGFCYFNNISISLLKLFSENKIKTAFVLDFDLHTGDGNINILGNRRDNFNVNILNPRSTSRVDYVNEVKEYMAGLRNIDILVASAGFDQGINDWGNLLMPEDYQTLGRLLREYSRKLCEGRRYALLEGGYNHGVIGNNVDYFCQGFK